MDSDANQPAKEAGIEMIVYRLGQVALLGSAHAQSRNFVVCKLVSVH